MTRGNSTIRTLTVALAACLLCFTPADAKKPDNPGGGGGGGGEPSYALTDLLGFPDNGYQSRGMFVTERDGESNVLVYGDSRLYPDPEGPATFHPALWRIAADGSFPESDPLDLGKPEGPREVTPSGMNFFGVGIVNTKVAMEQDEQGNWVFPSYVDVPGMPYQELPSSLSRNTDASAINDLEQIVGTERPRDPENPDSLIVTGAIWQLNSDGSVSDPISLGNFYPYDINNFGIMAGTEGGFPAIAWFEEGTLMMVHLDSSLRFGGGRVNALNDYPAGDDRLTVVGQSFRNETGDHEAYDSRRGYAWRPFDAADPTTVLGTLGGRSSEARDVNRAGHIVGWADTKRQGSQALIYKDGQMLNLNSMVDVGNATLRWAYAINEGGDIVGSMRIPRPVSEQRGFFLRPIN